MSFDQKGNNPGDIPPAPSVLQSPLNTRPPVEKSHRSLAILIVLMLTALGLMIMPRPTIYYPDISFDTPEGIHMDVLFNGQQEKAACETTLSIINDYLTKGCRECMIRSQTCNSNPTAEMLQRFGEAPLPVVSARIMNGVITYTSPQPNNALATCQTTERQVSLMANQTKFACYAAGTARPHTSFDTQQKKASRTTFTVLLAIYGILVASLVATILITYYRNLSLSVEQLALKCHPWLEKFSLASSDILILLGTFLAISWPASNDINRWTQFDRATVLSYGVIIIITIGWFWLILEHYARRRPFWDELREIARVLTIMFMVSSASVFLVGTESSRRGHLIVWALNFVLIPLSRAFFKGLLNDIGLWQRPAIIVGTGENARDAYLAIKSERGMGYRVLGFVKVCSDVTDNRGTLTIYTETFPILDFSTSLETLHESLGACQIIIALNSLADEKNQLYVQQLLSSFHNVHIIPSIRGLPLFGTQLSHFFSHEVLFLTVRNNLSRRGFVWIKRIFDVVLATLLLILLSPLFIILSYLIRRDGGMAFYGHVRVGHKGKPFKCLKFRSMRSDADKVLKELLDNDPVSRAEWDKDFKLRNDPRITSVGHFLRKTSLDELPQLINVIKGEMSLVGPRPIVTAELERYGDYVNLYLQSLPGVTGLWQVSGRNDTGYAERVGLDAWYVQNWSLWYDIAILFKTVNVVFNRRGAY